MSWASGGGSPAEAVAAAALHLEAAQNAAQCHMMVSDALVRSRNGPQFPHKMVASNFTLALDSIRKMAELDVDILCFGHGRPLTADVPRKMQDLVRKIKD